MGLRIYLDHAAATPMRPEAIAAVADGMARWANPSSPHAEGRGARAALEEARARIKAALGWRHELIFTAGATEAAALALRGMARARPVLVSAVEHLAVGRQAPAGAGMLPVKADGLIDPAGFGPMLRAAPEALVAIQHVNSETGVIQPIADLLDVVDLAGGVMFVDCAQSAGKVALPSADLIAVSAHKLGGPPGVGALLVRDAGVLAPVGGSQERGYRAGTENLPAILGFAAAAEADPVADGMAAWVRVQQDWRTRLDAAVERLGGAVVGGGPRLATIASYRFPGVRAASLLIRLDLAGIAVSSGSACSSGSIHASAVLKAMGWDDGAAGEVIRVSFGHTTTWDEVERFAATLAALVEERRTA